MLRHRSRRFLQEAKMRFRSGRHGLALGVVVLAMGTLTVGLGHPLDVPRAAARPPQTPKEKPQDNVVQAGFTPAVTSNYAQPVAYIFDTVPVTREELGEYLIKRRGAERLNNLVNQKIIEHFAREKGVEVTAAEIEADFAETIRGLAPSITVKEFESKILKPRNLTLYEWKEDVIRPKLLLSKMCKDRVHVSEEDMNQAFQAYYGEKVDCKIIMWRKEEQHIAMGVYPKIRASDEEFDRVARTQASPSLAAQAGHIQPIGRHTSGNELLEKAIFGLQPGELTEVLDTPEGYVVAKCIKRIPPETSKRLEDERDKLSAEIFRRRLEMVEIPKMFNELRELAHVKMLFKHEWSEEELVRDVNELLKPEGSKSTPHAKGSDK
jgi:hypothetical protein